MQQPLEQPGGASSHMSGAMPMLTPLQRPALAPPLLMSGGASSFTGQSALEPGAWLGSLSQYLLATSAATVASPMAWPQQSALQHSVSSHWPASLGHLTSVGFGAAGLPTMQSASSGGRPSSSEAAGNRPLHFGVPSALRSHGSAPAGLGTAGPPGDCQSPQLSRGGSLGFAGDAASGSRGGSRGGSSGGATTSFSFAIAEVATSLSLMPSALSTDVGEAQPRPLRPQPLPLQQALAALTPQAQSSPFPHSAGLTTSVGAASASASFQQQARPGLGSSQLPSLLRQGGTSPSLLQKDSTPAGLLRQTGSGAFRRSGASSNQPSR